jgi:hypothetical protein
MRPCTPAYHTGLQHILLLLLPAATAAAPRNNNATAMPAPRSHLVCCEEDVPWVHDHVIVRVAHALAKQLRGGEACIALAGQQQQRR